MGSIRVLMTEEHTDEWNSYSNTVCVTNLTSTLIKYVPQIHKFVKLLQKS